MNCVLLRNNPAGLNRSVVQFYFGHFLAAKVLLLQAAFAAINIDKSWSVNYWLAVTTEIPLSLPLGPCWELEERPVDSTVFLRALPSAFPNATTLFVEGSSIESDIADIYKRHASTSPYLPKSQTLWSTATIRRFTCMFSRALCESLAEASLHHAEPELFDHIFLYTGQEVLLEWPDAFANCIWVSKLIPEARLSEFASALGLPYKHARHG